MDSSHRLQRLQAKLTHLDPNDPMFAREQDLLRREIRLVKADSSKPKQKSAASSSAKVTGKKQGAARPARPGKGKGRKSVDKAKTKASSDGTTDQQDASGGIGKLLNPKNFHESLGTIVTLRTFCKNCLRYVQQADNLLDTLFVMGNSLQDSGVLKKLAESKGKNLNTSDFTNILMALMNTPVGAGLFKRISGGDNAEPAQPASPVEALAPATQTGNAPTTTPRQIGQPMATPPGAPPGQYLM